MFSLPRILLSSTVITRRSTHSPCQVMRHDISCASTQFPAGFRKQAQFFVLLVLCLAYIYTHTKHSCQPLPCKATAGPTSSSPQPYPAQPWAQMWAHVLAWLWPRPIPRLPPWPWHPAAGWGSGTSPGCPALFGLPKEPLLLLVALPQGYDNPHSAWDKEILGAWSLMSVDISLETRF